MNRLIQAVLIAMLLVVATPSRAQETFTPESGWWWNPAEPGYGFSLEIQDNFLFMIAFTYQGGAATWYAAEGIMPDRFSFSAPLYRRDNGTCLGCPFVPPSPTYGVGQNVSIDFLTETRANLTWGGRTVPIRRHDFFLSRNPAADPKTELWLGQWHIVMDFSAIPDAQDFPFFGEVLVFDLLDTSGSTDFFDGCRPENSTIGLCTNAALANHDASGYFAPGAGLNGQDVNFIIVNDDATTRLVFEVEVGLYQFDGYAKRCPKTIPPSQIISQCLDNDNIFVLPARGWRSASRAYVQGDDNAPSAVAPAPKDGAVAASARAGLPTQSAVAPAASPSMRPNLARSEAMMDAAVQRLESRQGQTGR